MLVIKTSIHVIRVFSNSFEYKIGDTGYSSRKEITKWNKKIGPGSRLPDDLKTLILSKIIRKKVRLTK